MLIQDLRMMYLRELATLEREPALYPDDQGLWTVLPGLPNAGGTLFLHLAGSLQHFFGAVLGNTGYVRNRDAEFSTRDLSRTEIAAQLSQARHAINAAFEHIREADLDAPFPVVFADAPFSYRLTLLQFSSHLAYHLGQIDFHRRAVTQQHTSANAIDPAGLQGL
ncbi:DinB family protein (plasmid) [Deinococcus sp. KNUC1210]|uniref:DinB family protein n=1 Tax=Deinococcus sp. KNUC1210 TaxID=2917691 RepID=UPI001EEFC5B6|nr:DinB family protein [Deinococcus sp. KNUC1210]ULH18302.1 DinB family protein [Deinococcus sp. KNUC1210]